MSSIPSSMLNADDDGRYRSSSSLVPQPYIFSHSLSENQNPPHKNQSLEDAFALLRVSPFSDQPFDFVGDNRSSDHINSAVGISSSYGHGFHPYRCSNVGQIHGWNNISGAAIDRDAMLWQNYWVGCDRDSGSSNRFRSSTFPTFSANGSSSSNDRFLVSEPFSSVPLSNGGGDNLQQKSHLRYRSNIPGFDVNNGWHPRCFNDLRGRVLSLAKDQHGCRIVLETIKSLTAEEVSFIFLELINHVTELMVDPFGNCVFQKMVEICSEEQLNQIILMVTEHRFQLVRLCLSPYGTRSVETLLEHVATQEQRALIMSALCLGVVTLAKDANGHRVILHCLKHFSSEDNKSCLGNSESRLSSQDLLNVVANDCFGMAIDKTGCCVLQQCINLAQGETKNKMIANIIVDASFLAHNDYGNYVLQHLLSLQILGVTECLLIQLEGQFLSLACNKFGSNVVERFFLYSGEQHSKRIILELLCNPNVAMLLVDPFGNYVIKSALLGAIRNALLKLVQLNAPMMRSNRFGKKLLARFDREKIRPM
ncbi:pumilio homolog 15-like [Gastrolobium bilobum]|uniref:pumilio homolog 15-like n=1 Tax=Gastrolobium bilobum TaxID=150636 RepID=UPI002AB044A3|nr:pumilio homolog 15-like [Gastrolobium bilobum]